jgi:exosortase A-associated hydrolase 1
MLPQLAGPGWQEEAITFECDGSHLLGILTRPREPATVGLVILPGGAQYRAGAHRQNIQLARSLAAHRIATLRFDARGMGDSNGHHPGFTDLGPDIEAAASALRAAVPDLSRLILFGLCDAASAVAIRLSGANVDGAILLNPWVRSDKSLAAARIRLHYPRQILRPEFWKALLSGRINVIWKAKEVVRTFAASRRIDSGNTLANRLYQALASDRPPVLIILAGQDITAAEFETTVLPRLPKQPSNDFALARIAAADHTFSHSAWWHSVHDHIVEWLAERQSAQPGYRDPRRRDTRNRQ